MPTLARKVRSAAEETGTVISSLGIYGNVLARDAASGETLDGFQALIAAAETFGTDLVCGFTGRVPDATITESLGPWKRVFGTLVQRARDHGVRLAMENCRMGGTWKTGDGRTGAGNEVPEVVPGKGECMTHVGSTPEIFLTLGKHEVREKKPCISSSRGVGSPLVMHARA